MFKYVIISLAIVSFAFCATAEEATKPNIIIILADDAGYADFGFTGCKDIPTPALDKMAEDGVFCTQGYVSAAVCCPSRMGLISGRYQQRFGAENNCPTVPTPNFTAEDLGLDLEEKTIADYLRECGYKTSILGKWHLGNLKQYHPNKRGFDYFFGLLEGSRSYWPNKSYGPDNPHRILRNLEPVDEEKELTYLTTDLTDEAVKYIKANSKNPFFMFLSYTAPHGPMHATQEYLDQFPNIKDTKRKTYAAMVKCMDDGIGRVFKTLSDLDIEENTLVFFLSDNGGADGNGSHNAPLRGFKGTYWEGGIRVPFLVKWPAKLPAGIKYNFPVTALDILPTALAAADNKVKIKNPLDGKDIVPYLSAKKHKPAHDEHFWRFWRVSAVHSGDWKVLVVKDDPLKEDRKDIFAPQLFNLAEDPYEGNNVADQNPKILKQLLKKLDKWDSKLQPPRWYDGKTWQKWEKVQLENHREDNIYYQK